MALKNACELCYEEVRFQDKPALFTSLRVSMESVPDGLHRYEIRYDEDTCDPCQLARRIVVNHYGTILTAEPISLPEDGYLNFEPGELAFVRKGCYTVEDFQRKYNDKKPLPWVLPGRGKGGTYAEEKTAGAGGADETAVRHGEHSGGC